MSQIRVSLATTSMSPSAYWQARTWHYQSLCAKTPVFLSVLGFAAPSWPVCSEGGPLAHHLADAGAGLGDWAFRGAARDALIRAAVCASR